MFIKLKVNPCIILSH